MAIYRRRLHCVFRGGGAYFGRGHFCGKVRVTVQAPGPLSARVPPESVQIHTNTRDSRAMKDIRDITNITNIKRHQRQTAEAETMIQTAEIDSRDRQETDSRQQRWHKQSHEHARATRDRTHQKTRETAQTGETTQIGEPDSRDRHPRGER